MILCDGSADHFGPSVAIDDLGLCPVAAEAGLFACRWPVSVHQPELCRQVLHQGGLAATITHNNR